MFFSESGDFESLAKAEEGRNLSSNEDFNSQLESIVNNSNDVGSSLTFDETANASNVLSDGVVDQGSNAESPETEECREDNGEELTVLHPDHVDYYFLLIPSLTATNETLPRGS